MRTHSLTVTIGTLLVLVLLAPANAFAQAENPRFGVWKMMSDAPAPSSNIMTYEAYGNDGMKITVESTNSRGQDSAWSYTTEFDGAFHPVSATSP